MYIAEAKKTNSTEWRNRDVSWSDFIATLKEKFIRTPETMAEYAKMTKDEQGVRKALPGGFVGGRLKDKRRLKENVVCRTMITLDGDYATVKDWSNFTCLHDDLAVACYPTHKSRPDKPRLRWVFPASRDMTPEEYPAVARRVAEWVGIETMDVSTYDLNRLFYYPSVPQDAPYELLTQDGEPVDVDAVLATYGAEPGAWKDASLWPIGSRELTQTTDAKGKVEDPTTKKGDVGVFCRTYDVEGAIAEFLSDVYEETATPGRYTYVKGSTAGGAVVVDNGNGLYSFHSTDPAGGRTRNAFDLVRIHKFGALDDGKSEDGTQATKLPSFQAMVEWMSELPAVEEKRNEEAVERFNEELGDLIGSTAPDDDVEAENDGVDDESGDDWKKQLTFNTKTKKLEPTINNAMLLLANLSDFAGKLGYNPMNDTITVKGDLPWWNKRNRDELEAIFDEPECEGSEGEESDLRDELAATTKEWGENDWAEYYAYFERLGYTTGGQKNGVLDNALRNIATRNAYHPIRSYLQGLVWDGRERLDTLFVRWLGAKDNELNRVITRRWMMAAVDRVMRPGCQFDEILITKGPQGIGKSKFLRILARGFFTSSIKALDVGKTTSELLQGIWIAEIGELDAMKRGEQTSIKNFITTVSDRYRGAYARAAVDHPRQCVLAGTSNEGSFLRDETGERRYWIMPVDGTGDRGELNGFKEEVDQVWAEAFHAWKERVREMRRPGQKAADVELYLYLREDRLEKEMETRRQQYKMPDEDRLDIADYLDRLRPDNWEELTPLQRRAFFRDEGVYDLGSCHYRVDRISTKEVSFELFCADRGNKSYHISDVLDSTPGWRKADKMQNVLGYGSSGRPVWYRIGGRFDPDVMEEKTE